ncbi:TPA: glycosyltransferase [Vibrio parahaemolyticus]
MGKTSPIVLFVYNRPDHTQRTIEALKNNILASESELFIYSDAPKNDNDKLNVDQVRQQIEVVTGFKKVTIIKQSTNMGLAKSIIDGVTDIVNRYGKVIVLEDDLVTSPYFLKFMNDALEFYSNEEKVFHVSGWNYPIHSDGLSDTFLWRTMNCWGWGTWSDRWQYFEKNTDKLIESFSKSDIKRFNLDGYENFWGQVISNKNGKIDTWAIYWYASIFKNNGLCLNPTLTFVNNIGLDGSGEHCGINTSYMSDLNLNDNIKFEKNYKENSSIINRIQEFYKKNHKSLFFRLLNKISRVLIKRNLIV